MPSSTTSRTSSSSRAGVGRSGGPHPKVTAMDWKLELVVVPVSDVDRAKRFYAEQVGFGVDVDRQMTDTFRIVQLTPQGSACSIAIGTGLGDGIPGSIK